MTVSLRVSPLSTLEPEPLTLTTSAERRLPASSNEVEVRVEASKNMLMIVRPRRVGTFLMSRSMTSAKRLPTRRMRATSARSRSSMVEQRAATHGVLLSGSSTTSSAPSTSARCTAMRSERWVGRFLPT